MSDRPEKQDVIEHYKRDAGETYRTYRYSSKGGQFTSLRELNAMLYLLGPLEQKRVLDVGCGYGRVSEAMLRAGAGEVVGGDPSEGMLADAEKLTEDWDNYSVVTLDAENLPFPDNEFDMVVSMKVLIHFSDPRKALAEMARVVKPGGLVVVDVANLLSLNIFTAASRRFFGKGKVANYYLTPWEIRKKYLVPGLPLERVVGVSMMPFRGLWCRLLGMKLGCTVDLCLGKLPLLKYIAARCELAFRKEKV